jgi:hypothetical protein
LQQKRFTSIGQIKSFKRQAAEREIKEDREIIDPLCGVVEELTGPAFPSAVVQVVVLQLEWQSVEV